MFSAEMDKKGKKAQNRRIELKYEITDSSVAYANGFAYRGMKNPQICPTIGGGMYQLIL